MNNERDCKHGALARSCEVCDLEAIAAQAEVMIRAKGRYNTEQATIKLAALLGIELKAYETAPQPVQAAPQPATGLTDERAAFEAWWPSVGQTIGKVAAWDAWQARAALSQQGRDADHNAPWLSLAHVICADAGIPTGNLMARLEALRDKLEQQGRDAEQLRSAINSALFYMEECEKNGALPYELEAALSALQAAIAAQKGQP